MAFPATIQVERQAWAEHPALEVWSQLPMARALPIAIETLKQKEKSAVYRLAGAGPRGTAVIAKRCLMATAATERAIYEGVLPRLPVPALQLFGFERDRDPHYGWLFLEDAGAEIYSPTVPEHRAEGARWLASLHTSAASVSAARRLPERGAGSYRHQMRLARDAITASFCNPALGAGDIATLREILVACDFLESRWARLEELCRKTPATLVHGDLKEKNIRVRPAGGRLEVLAFDWEIAGWGTPATDLLRCADLALYWSEVRRHWPELKLPDLERLVKVGAIFRALISIYWKSLSLRYEWVEWPINHLAFYREWLARSVQALQIQ